MSGAGVLVEGSRKFIINRNLTPISTIEMWLRIERASGIIFETNTGANAAANLDNHIMLYIAGCNTFGLNAESDRALSSQNAVVLDTWTHVAVTTDYNFVG
jgi:hypothetical protein